MGLANPATPLGPCPVLEQPWATCVPSVPCVAGRALGQPGLDTGTTAPSGNTAQGQRGAHSCPFPPQRAAGWGKAACSPSVGTRTKDSSITGRLPRQSEVAPVSGAERNCRTEKMEPIRPERWKSRSPQLSLSPQESDHASPSMPGHRP